MEIGERKSPLVFALLATSIALLLAIVQFRIDKGEEIRKSELESVTASSQAAFPACTTFLVETLAPHFGYPDPRPLGPATDPSTWESGVDKIRGIIKSRSIAEGEYYPNPENPDALLVRVETPEPDIHRKRVRLFVLVRTSVCESEVPPVSNADALYHPANLFTVEFLDLDGKIIPK